MELMTLYAQVKNPFENTYLASELIKVYLNTVNYESFYDRLMLSLSIKNCYSEEPLLETYAADRFYAMVFNHWKECILQDNINQVTMMKYGVSEYTIDQLRKTLKDIPHINSLQDIKKETREEVDFLLERYKGYYVDREWITVDSYYMIPTQESKMDIEHYLYLNINSKADLYKFSMYFVEKCNTIKIPYDFKFTTQLNYDDVLIIGSSTENLINYINILREIKERYPEITVSIKRPHILTGKIDDWIGYGTAPQDDTTSYIIKRSKCLYQVIDQTLNDWFIKDISNKIYIKEHISYKEYIARRLIDSLISEVERKDQNFFIQKYVGRNIKKVINDLIENHWQDIFYLTDDIKVHISPTKDLIYERQRLKYLRNNLVNDIVRDDPNFMVMFHQRLKYICEDMGIDYKSFCFDQSMINKMRSIDNAVPTYDTNIVHSELSSVKNASKTANILETDLWMAPDGSIWASYEDYLNERGKVKQHKI